MAEKRKLTVEESNALSSDEYREWLFDELEASGHATRAQVAELQALGMSGGGLYFLTKEEAAERIAKKREEKAVREAKERALVKPREDMVQCWECGRWGVPDKRWSTDGGGWYCGC